MEIGLVLRDVLDLLHIIYRAGHDILVYVFQADQQMEESVLTGRGIMFYRLLEAVPYQGIGDKIKLPPSCFTELSDQGALDKGPMYFQLSVVHQEGSSDMASMDVDNRRTTHSGVLEFTADEGSVALPPHVWHNLFPGGTIKTLLIEVRYVWLPKGTYAKLQPEGIGFLDLPNHKAILETSLRQHATLSQSDILTVNYGELAYKLQVLELKPSSSVSVLETDIEVDIVGPDSASERTDQHALSPLVLGKLEAGLVEEGNYIYYKFSIDNDTWGRIASGDARVEVRVEAETDGGDTDLYISRHPLIFPTRHQHEWSSHDIGSKALILSSRDNNLGAATYSVGVYGFKGRSKYQISVSIEDDFKQKLGQQAASSSSAMEIDTVECRNCKHCIPSRTIALHEAYCSRHNIVCQHAGCGIVLRVEEVKNHVHCNKCGQAFQHGEMEKHMKVFHEPLHCPCGVVLEKEQMVSNPVPCNAFLNPSYGSRFLDNLLASCFSENDTLQSYNNLPQCFWQVQHQASVCPLRLIACRFCGDMVQAGNSPVDARDRLRGLTEHESICGSRTAPCDSCGRAVMLKDMDIHQIAVHQKS